MKRDGKEYFPAKTRIELTSGETILELRKLKGWTQEELAKRSGISAQNLSMLEHNHVPLGRKRASQIAEALGIHPGTLMFPNYVPLHHKKAA
ncbi:MAG: helix-turn-helix transcriptional regulator [Chlamydiae bacterium]|nr:helix-turn-helix transcriptional regulator [Chlamydiota bacterium]MBI3266839.1 helix-turn-helix transcriptional regulator [Chlamydiota bacterium]